MEHLASVWRSGRMRHLAAFLSMALLIVACMAAPSPSAPELSSGSVSGHGMTLAVTARPAAVAAGQHIEVEAVVTNDGSEPIMLSGSGSGFVLFSVTRVSDGLTSGEPLTTGDCVRHVVPVGEPTIVPFSKSGGWSEGDPNAAFLRTYFSEPELSLPPGVWRIDVTTLGNLGEDCTGPQLDLETSLLETVSE
jgi:hypothetical protein